MSNFTRNLRERGFTLVELLIVVIILAILAAITIPQFANSAVAARESALDSDLATLRSAIELYRVQHNVYPGAVTAVGPACAPGATGTGIATAGAGATASQAFIEQLSLFSDAAGATCTVNAGGAYRFGPYLRRGIPNDSIGGTVGSLNTGIVTTAAATPIGAPAAATGGWAYDTASGQILMNSNAAGINGAAYSTH